MFGYYMKRMLTSRIFYLCIAVSVGILVMGCYQALIIAQDNVVSWIECIDETLDAFGIYAVIAPVLMSVTFLFFYAEELEKRAVYYQMLRTSRKKYYKGQILSALASACLIVTISLVIFGIICFSCGVGWENVSDFGGYDNSNIGKYFHGNNSWKMTIWFCCLTIMYCLPWPLIGMVVSLLTKNKYILIASPFVIFMAWNYIVQLIYSVCHNILWILPTQPLLGMGLPWEAYWSIELTILYPVVYHVVLIGGLSIAFCFIRKRRFLREGI